MKKLKQAKQQPIKVTRSESIRLATTQSFLHNDTRVITRRRDVLLYELAATEEHLNGLRASLTEVGVKKERLEAQIAGLTRVLTGRTLE